MILETNEQLQQAMTEVEYQQTIEVQPNVNLLYDGPIPVFCYIQVEGPSQVIISGIDYGCSIGITTSPLGRRE